MKSVSDIRSEFLSFFQGKGHEIVPSSPLVPQNDPTLMFTNSGMVQFKNVFTGVEKRPYTRATTAQKCVRAGGKHNDLENVGYTARHHTFFEMMGNFSFGDYFKEEAIVYAWDLVTKNFSMPQDKLLVTVHSSDEEAAALWRKVTGFADNRIIRIDTNDNFWMMGDTGPCGPCSEIFIDQGDKIAGGPPGSADQDGDRFLEFWNLVFMQYEQEPDGKGGYNRKPLPKPSIDTGMGLERMAGILQGKYSVYDIDLLRGIIEHCADLTGVSPDGAQAASHRVIADHLRASAFLIADGVLPSNEGRGYVLRRIMRRGMRHAQILGAKEPLMYRLFPTLLGSMGTAYPELKRAGDLITETLRSEEERFKRTLEQGLKILDEETKTMNKGQNLSGDVAFRLYDTFGFPLDLTQDALKARGIGVDVKGFEKSMTRQKEEARKAWSGSGETGTEKIWFEILNETGPTEFLGYETESAEGKVLAIVKDGKKVTALKTGETGAVITNQTPFYGESGGQVGDTGRLVVTSAPSKSIKGKTPESDRLIFSIIGKKDLEDVFNTLNSRKTAEIISFLSWPMTREQAQWWCDKSEKGIASGQEYLFIAHDKKSGTPVGCIGVHRQKDERYAELGYWIAEPMQKQGFATEMTKAVTQYALDVLDIDELFATTLPENESSGRVLEKSDFAFDGKKNVISMDGNFYLKNVYRLVNGAQVTDTKKVLAQLYLHYVTINRGEIGVGDSVQMQVNHDRRSAIRANHSVTHLLHEALRQVLGTHVSQKGSLQDEGRTRFDISHPKQIAPEELKKVEQIVADQIRAAAPVETRLMALDEARETGAMALFGEKYDDEVRVVSMGVKAPGANKVFSVELCGGTHVKNTGDIGRFKIVSENSLSSGVRRVEALTGARVDAFEKNREQAQQDVVERLKAENQRLREELAAVGGTAPSAIPADSAELEKENRKLEKDIGDLRRKQATDQKTDFKIIAGVKFAGKVLAGFPARDLKPMVDELKAQIGSGVVVLVATDEGKASIVVGVTSDLTGKISAVDLVKIGAEALGGKGGGGRPDMAQAGGPDADAANDAVTGIEKALAG